MVVRIEGLGNGFGRLVAKRMAGGPFYKAMERRYADELLTRGRVQVTRLDAFGEKVTLTLRDPGEGRFVKRAEGAHLTYLRDLNQIHVAGTPKGSPAERRARELGRTFINSMGLRGVEKVTISSDITLQAKVDISKRVVALCMSLEPLPAIADAAGYDAIVEISHRWAMWKPLDLQVMRAFHAHRRTHVFTLDDMLYRDRRTAEGDWGPDPHPGLVKPARYSHELEVRFLAEYQQDLEFDRRVAKCPELARHARLHMVKTSSGWQRV